MSTYFLKGCSNSIRQRSLLKFFTILWDKEISCSFTLVLQETAGEEILESCKSELVKEITANNFAFSEVQESGPLNKGGILNLTLQQILLALS